MRCGHRGRVPINADGVSRIPHQTRLQVPFERHRTALVGELDDDINNPGPSANLRQKVGLPTEARSSRRGPTVAPSSFALGASEDKSGAMVGNLRVNHERRLVAQICPRWNRLQPWFELAEALKNAA
jgi:hypothetical protein